MKHRAIKDLKVLLVEDEENITRLLKDAIGENFHSFIIAKDGLEGIALFKKRRPDIVITDIEMPNLSGLEMARELKQIDPNIVIIMLSAFSEKEKFLSAIDVGVSKYFMKPFEPDDILEYIEQIIPKISNKLIGLGDEFTFNKSSNSLYKNDKFIALSKKEILFLSLMLRQKCEVIDVITIKKTLWNEEASDERVRTFIRRFREKTSKDLVLNITGVGYKLTINEN
ncbi:response regulator [Sulfurimonas sp.]|uniref:response regulator transcription factor n=1 Tax=Sulfurimonas sp. TaxID=2022749 RepID=UPI0025EC7635|nr:response regulator [Sulfurimonas sp.]MDD5156882.1 response regulator [Sulfurimonas sp.]